MQFDEQERKEWEREWKTREREMEREREGFFSNWRLPCSRQEKEHGLSRSLSTRSFFLFNHTWRKKKRENPTHTYVSISFPFLSFSLSLFFQQEKKQKIENENDWKRTTFAFHWSGGFILFFFPTRFHLRIEWLNRSQKSWNLRVGSIVPRYNNQVLPSVPGDTLIGEIFQ